MNQFIELSRRNGKKLIINTNLITSFYACTLRKNKDSEEMESVTLIKTTHEVTDGYGCTFYAKETYDEIKQLMNLNI